MSFLDDYRELERSERAPKRLADHSAKWAKLEAVGSVNGQIGDRLAVFCESKRISVAGLEALGARVVVRRGNGVSSSPSPGTNDTGAGDGDQVPAARTAPRTSRRPKRRRPGCGRSSSASATRSTGSSPRARPTRARLFELVGDVAAILVLPAGARTFKREWADADPARGDASRSATTPTRTATPAPRRRRRSSAARTVRVRPPSRAATGATGTAAATSSSSSLAAAAPAALRVLVARRLPRARVPEGRAAARRARRDLPRARVAAHGLRRRRLRRSPRGRSTGSRTWPPASSGSASRCRGRSASASSRTRDRRACSSRSSRRRSRAGTGPTSRTTCSSSQGPWGEFTFADPEAREALVAFCEEHADRRRHREPDARPRGRRLRPARRDAAVRRLARRVRPQDASAPSGSCTTRTRPARSPATGAGTPTRRCQLAAGRQPAAHEARLGEDRWATLPTETIGRRCRMLEWIIETQGYSVTELDTVGASDSELEERIADVPRRASALVDDGG